jgi:hypothetical protein
MSEDRPTDVLGGLPRTRPHRRSTKRAAPARTPTTPRAPARTKPKSSTAAKRAENSEAPQPTPIRSASAPRKPRPQRLRQPAQPAGTPAVRRERAAPSPPSGTELLGTVVHAAAELAEIGLTASARALRNALTRLPHP